MGGSSTGGFRRGALVGTTGATETSVVRDTVATLARACEHVTVLLPAGSTALCDDVGGRVELVPVPPVPGLDSARPPEPDVSPDVVVWAPSADPVARLKGIDETVAALRGERRREPFRPRFELPWRGPLEIEALEANFAPALVRADPDLVLALDPGALSVCRSVQRRARARFQLEYVPR
jgi:hypothetical protein